LITEDSHWEDNLTFRNGPVWSPSPARSNSRTFAGLSDPDRYVLGRWAARGHVPAEKLAQLPQGKIDQHIPGARLGLGSRSDMDPNPALPAF
jgi:hypothetical protein